MFGLPRAVVTTDRVADVLPCLRDVEARVRRKGLYAAGFVSYEAAPGCDPALHVRPPNGGSTPLLWFGLFDAPHRVRELPASSGSGQAGDLRWAPDWSRAEYGAAAGRVRAHLEQGNSYQVNLTFRLHAPWTGDPWGLFCRMASAQPAAYGAYLDVGRFAIASASPELFFERDGRVVTCRPMKGTAARGRYSEEDRARRDALVASEKNRAENVMIVDMVRNDLGRVARIGSVEVPALFTAERYPTLWQMTSTVTAETDAGLADLMASLFPCASVTGAPKVRTTQIIAELEASPRGIYTGSLGMVTPDGRAQFNVAIRTVLVDREAGVATCGVGSGVVWDSRAEAEYDECLLKARFLTAARWRPTLLETLRWNAEAGFAWLDRHLARLRDSADYFDTPLDEALVQARLAACVDAYQPAGADLVIRLRVGPDGAIDVSATPYVEQPLPVSLAIARMPIASGDTALFHKTTDRARYDMARADHPEADDVLLWNERGHATETTIANLAVQLDGTWWTPPLSAGLLPGTFRAALLEDGCLRERDLPLALVRTAGALAVFNSVRGWRPAVLRSSP